VSERRRPTNAELIKGAHDFLVWNMPRQLVATILPRQVRDDVMRDQAKRDDAKGAPE